MSSATLANRNSGRGRYQDAGTAAKLVDRCALHVEPADGLVIGKLHTGVDLKVGH